MTQTVFKIKKLPSYIYFIINIMFLFIILYVTIFEIYKHSAFWFFIYLIIYIYLPGRFFAKRIFKYEFLNIADLILDFYVGMGIIAIEYFLLFFLNKIFMIKYISLVFALAELIIISKKYLIKNNSNVNHRLADIINTLFVSKEATTLLFMITFSVVCCLFVNNFKYPLINSIMNPDRPYQISNLNGLATSEPFVSMTVYGSEFKYHYYNYLLGAICKIVFEIPGYYFINYYMPLYIPILLSMSFYSLAKKYSSNNILISIIYVIMCFNLLSPKFCYFILHLFTNTNSMGFAIPLMMILYLALINTIESNNFSIRINILLCLLIFTLTGVKGPTAVIIVMSYIVYVLIYKIDKKWILTAFLLLFTLILTYKLIITSQNVSSFASIGLASNIIYPEYVHNIDNNFIRYFVLLLFFLPTLINHFNFFVITCIIYLIISIKKMVLREVPNIDLLIIMIFAGVFAGFIFKIAGGSQLYFLISIMPLIAIVNINFIESIDYKNSLVALLGLLFLFVLPEQIDRVYSATNYHYDVGFFATIKEAISYYTNNLSNDNGGLYEGYEYIRKNTPKDSIIATNKLIYCDYNDDLRGMNLAAFGERHVYLEGYQYAGINAGYTKLDENIENNNIIFSKYDGSIKYNILFNNKVNYVFLYKNYDGFFDDSYDAYKKVFENDEVVIFKIIF